MTPLLAIGPEPLELEQIAALLASGGTDPGADGAVVTFLGLVRNHNAGRSVRRLDRRRHSEPGRRAGAGGSRAGRRMRVTVRLFARLRDIAGVSELSRELA